MSVQHFFLTLQWYDQLLYTDRLSLLVESVSLTFLQKRLKMKDSISCSAGLTAYLMTWCGNSSTFHNNFHEVGERNVSSVQFIKYFFVNYQFRLYYRAGPLNTDGLSLSEEGESCWEPPTIQRDLEKRSNFSPAFCITIVALPERKSFMTV